MVCSLRSPQQVKLHEARNILQMGVSAGPELLKRFL
jgi:hypothetical protein